MSIRNMLPGALGPLFQIPVSMVFDSDANETVITNPSGNPNWFYPYDMGRVLWFVDNPEQDYVVKRITNPAPSSIAHANITTFLHVTRNNVTRIITDSDLFDVGVGVVRFDTTEEVFRVDQVVSSSNITVRGNATINNDSDRSLTWWNLENGTDFDNEFDIDWQIVVEGDCTSESGKFRILGDGDTYNAGAEVNVRHSSNEFIAVGSEQTVPKRLWGWLQFADRSSTNLLGQTVSFVKLELEVADDTNLRTWASGTLLTQNGSEMQLNESVDLSSFYGSGTMGGSGATWGSEITGSITDITQAFPLVMTVGSGHGVSGGNYIVIRDLSGMVEINDLETTVSSITSTTITLPINSVEFSPYISGGTWAAVDNTINLPPTDLSPIVLTSDAGDMAFIQLSTAIKFTERIPEWFPITFVDNGSNVVKVVPPPRNDGSAGYEWSIWNRDQDIMFVGGAENGDIPDLGSGWFAIKSLDNANDKVVLNLTPSGTLDGIWHINPPIITLHMVHEESDISIPSMNAVGGSDSPPHPASVGWKTLGGDAREKDAYLLSTWPGDVLLIAVPYLDGGTKLIIGKGSNSYLPGHTEQSQLDLFTKLAQQIVDEQNHAFTFMMKFHSSAWDMLHFWEGIPGSTPAASQIDYVASDADSRIRDKWPRLTVGFNVDNSVDLFVQGVDVFTIVSSGDLFISGPKLSTTSGDLFIAGPKQINISGDLFAKGLDTVNASCDLFIQGLDNINNSADLFISGSSEVNVITASIDLFVEGSDAIEVSGDLFIAGLDNASTSGDLFIGGVDNVSTSGDLFINGLDNINSFIDLFIHGFDATTTSGNLFIGGQENVTTSGDLFISGPKLVTTSGELFIHGFDTLQTSGDLFITGRDTIDESKDLFIKGSAIISISGDLFINGIDSITISGDMFIGGQDSTTKSVDLFIGGKNSISTSGDLFIVGNDSVSSSGDLFVSSKDNINNSIDLFIQGLDTIQISGDLFIKGPVLTSTSGDLFVEGHETFNTLGDLFISGPKLITTSGDLFLHGLDMTTTSGDLFVAGQDSIDTSIDLFVKGLDFISISGDLFIKGKDAITTSGDLFIQGSLGVVPTESGSVTLFVNGVVAIPDVVCPTLDITASIQIKDSLIKIYQGRIDALINQLGKNIRLIFDPTIVPCPNCLYDTLRKRSTGIHIDGGPRPFKRGRKCPYCKGRGLLETSVEKCIKCLVKWNPGELKGYGISIENRQGIVRLKTYLTLIDDIVGANTAIIDYDKVDIVKLTVRKIRGPTPVGLREDRYCISFWELI